MAAGKDASLPWMALRGRIPRRQWKAFENFRKQRLWRVAWKMDLPPGEEGFAMLIPRCHGEPADGQGCSRTDLAELRRQLADPSRLNGESRQRLVKLAQRLARIQAWGDEYRRVDLSEAAQTALGKEAVCRS
jgi:hypothetical protein